MNNKHITVYKKENLPERWRFKNSQLVAPIIVVAELGWYILTVSFLLYSIFKIIFSKKQNKVKQIHDSQYIALCGVYLSI